MNEVWMLEKSNECKLCFCLRNLFLSLFFFLFS